MKNPVLSFWGRNKAKRRRSAISRWECCTCLLVLTAGCAILPAAQHAATQVHVTILHMNDTYEITPRWLPY